jgi:hypothetical protein
MTTKYADRAFISINGAQLVDLQSATLKQNQNAKAVQTMTPDRFNRGFVAGNIDIDITASVAVQNTLARPKLEGIDYETNDVQLTFVCGADQFVCTGLFLKDAEDAASGVGAEAKATFNFGAIKVTDAVGNSALFDLSL